MHSEFDIQLQPQRPYYHFVLTPNRKEQVPSHVCVQHGRHENGWLFHRADWFDVLVLHYMYIPHVGAETDRQVEVNKVTLYSFAENALPCLFQLCDWVFWGETLYRRDEGQTVRREEVVRDWNSGEARVLEGNGTDKTSSAYDNQTCETRAGT